MKHKVNIGRDNKFYGLKKTTYNEGEKVLFYVMVASDMSYRVTSDDVKISMEDSNEYYKVYYSFIMPNKDVTIDIESNNDMTCLKKETLEKKEIIKEKNKKYCPDCGLEIIESIKFCPKCGCKIDFFNN